MRSDHAPHLATGIPTNSPYYLAGDLTSVTAKKNHFTILLHGRLAIIYQGSFAPARFAAYAESGAFCPEVFHRAEVGPGQTTRWSAQYKFIHHE
jgi:hypothetical protein